MVLDLFGQHWTALDNPAAAHRILPAWRELQRECSSRATVDASHLQTITLGALCR